MKKRTSTPVKAFSFFLSLILVLSLITVPSFAASPNLPSLAKNNTVKCYSIKTGKTTTYSDSACSKETGFFRDNEEVILLEVTASYCKISYPKDGGGRKTAYAHTSDLLLNANPSDARTATGKVTTYRRDNTSVSYGYIAKNDSVIVLGTRGSFTQTVYPVSGGYKVAFVSTADANKYLSKGTSANKTLTNALYNINVKGSYISCGYDGYVNTKGRHEGIDFSKAYGASVYSLTDGKVLNIVTGKEGSGGLSTIAIYDQAHDKTVIYLHTAPLSSLKVGATVKAGDKIATESYRGVSSKSSSHTHVEVRNGKCKLAAKSLSDYTLDNPNPKSYWNSLGYTVK